MAASKTASKTKAAAARAETNGEQEPHNIEWGGLTLTIPAVPPRALMYDFAMLATDGDNSLASYMILKSVVGADQFLAIRNRIEQDPELDDSELLNLVLAPYGVTLGESSASEAS